MILLVALFFLSAVSVRADDRVTIVALGDSTTAGSPFFLSPVERPPAGEGDARGAYGYWLERRHPEWRVVNLGVAGQRTDQIASRLEGALALGPKALVLLAGVNDVYQGRPAPEIIARLDAMYRAAAARGVPVVACTVLPYDGASPAARHAREEVNAWIRSQAGRVHLCDTAAAVESAISPGTLAGTPDGLHPDIGGYHAVADAISPVLEKIVTRSGRYG